MNRRRTFAASVLGAIAIATAACSTPETVTETVTATQTVYQTETETVTASPEPPPGPKTTFGDGTWIVGTDIAPGTYRSSGGSGCYWERTTGTGDLDDIIDNDNASGPAVVVIAPDDPFFVSKGCGTWTQV